MSNTNYDVELNVSYGNSYKHYLPGYQISVPYYRYGTAKGDVDPDDGYIYRIVLPDELQKITGRIYCRSYSWAKYEAAVSFDSGSEENISYIWYKVDYDSNTAAYKKYPPTPYFCDPSAIQAGGVYSKCYIRNPYRSKVQFVQSGCILKVNHLAKADFEIQLNSSGNVATVNPSFKGSTVQKNVPAQYEWRSIVGVYWKKSTQSEYQSAAATCSGSWSDVTIQTTQLHLDSGYTYNMYVVAEADDGTRATSNVYNFSTTDGTAVATCISPVGTYTYGTVTFIWSHSTEYGTPQYAYDLQYSANNGGTWTTVANHVVSMTTNATVTINTAGLYVWRVRTYNTMNQAGSWSQASFINNIPASPPSGLSVNTKGRPTVSWVSANQVAYQVQMLSNDTIVYDSGAVYNSQNTHFVNNYFDDTVAYNVKVRIYNNLGNVSSWVNTGYQQAEVADVVFDVSRNANGGAVITVTPDVAFIKYYLKRNDVLIGEIVNNTYTDYYSIGQTNYTVVGVTLDDQSDLQTKGINVTYPCATIVTMDGVPFTVNRRVNDPFELEVSGEADINRVSFLGDSVPSHFSSKMRIKSFTVSCWDDNNILDDILGQIVFYADNFGEGGYCYVTNYTKTESFIKNSQGIYANEVSLTLEVTNYDDSIKYPL